MSGPASSRVDGWKMGPPPPDGCMYAVATEGKTWIVQSAASDGGSLLCLSSGYWLLPSYVVAHLPIPAMPPGVARVAARRW